MNAFVYINVCLQVARFFLLFETIYYMRLCGYISIDIIRRRQYSLQLSYSLQGFFMAYTKRGLVYLWTGWPIY